MLSQGPDRLKSGSRYAAFISYSTAADGKLAPALQNGLQKFAKPWYRLRALRVFRDQTGLALTPELWGAIEIALGSSDYFLLLASPQAAKSKWVEQEVEWWLAHWSASHLLIVLTEGDVFWDSGAGDFDWTRTNALPKGLQKAFAQEPLYLDLRWARTSTHLSLLRPDFADAIARLSATLRGVSLDNLIGEQVRQHQKTMRLARRAIAVVGVIAVLSLIATIYSLQARKMAGSVFREQQSNAALRAAQTLSDALAEQAVNLHATDPDLATLLAAEAVRIHAGEAAESALRGVLFAELTPVRTFSPGAGEDCFAVFHPDGRKVLTWGENVPRLLDADTGKVLMEYRGDSNRLEDVKFSGDGRRIAGLGSDDKVRIWDTASGNKVSEGPADHAAAVLLNRDGTRLLLLNEGSGGALWNVATGTRISDIDFMSDHLFLNDRVQQASFNTDGSRLAVLTRGGNASVFEGQTGKVLIELTDHTKTISSVAFSADDRELVTASDDGTVRIWRADTGQCEAVLEYGAPLSHAVFSPDGHWVAARDDSQSLQIWDVALRKKTTRVQLGSKEAGPSIFNFSPDGKCLLTSGYGIDFATVWDTRTGQRLAELKANAEGGAIRTMGFSTTGKRVILGAVFGPARLYETDVCGSVEDLLSFAARRVSRQLTSEERQKYQIPLQK